MNNLKGYMPRVEIEPGLLQTEVPPTCPDCQGMGFVLTHGQRVGGVYKPGKPMLCPNPECPVVGQQRTERLGRLTQSARLPEEYRERVFADWQNLLDDHPDTIKGKRDAYGAALAFTAARDAKFYFTMNQAAECVNLSPLPEGDQYKNWVVFSGDNGVGKTSLMASILNVLTDNGVGVLYIRAREIIQAVQERYGEQPVYKHNFGNTKEATMAVFEQIPVLAIDEMTLENYSRDRIEILETVIRTRHGAYKPTLITTNLDYDAFTDDRAFGRRIGDVVQQRAHWIKMTGLELRYRSGEVESR